MPETTASLRQRAADGARCLGAAGLREATDLAVRTQTAGAVATVREAVSAEREYVEGADSTSETVLRAGQSGSQLVGVMLTITLAAAIGFVGVQVNSEVEDSITNKDLSSTNAENQTIYENTSESISSGFTDAMGLTDIVFLVLMFSVILAALLAFRSRR